MTLVTLAQTIRHLPAQKRLQLFDKLQPSLEDYLLTKIVRDRFQKTSSKRIPWKNLKS